MKSIDEKSFTDFYCIRLGVIVRKITRLMNNRCLKYGITIGQSQVLFHLLDQNGSSVKDIAARLQLDSPAITALVDYLVKGEFVERREDPGNRRSMQIFLTPKGKEVAEEVLSIVREFNRGIEASIDPVDLERVIVGLENEIT